MSRGRLRERIEAGADARAILGRLEAGEDPADVAGDLGREPIDVVAALAGAALGDRPDDGPPLVHSPPRRPGLITAALPEALARLLPSADDPRRLALAAGLLQALDAWDASHAAAQRADDLGEHAHAAYWHAIAHRREPDPGNAGYWFRRVGRHPVFATLAAEARALAAEVGEPALADRLARGGWDPMAMVDLCTRARPGTPAARLAGRLQRREMLLLLDATWAAL